MNHVFVFQAFLVKLMQCNYNYEKNEVVEQITKIIQYTDNVKIWNAYNNMIIFLRQQRQKKGWP